METYVTAAFRSSHTNHGYVFMKKEYVLLDYNPGRADDRVVYGPVAISHGFPFLEDTAFGEYGITCAFGSHDENEAFIFSGKLCARINYAPQAAKRIIKGPITIAKMFPFLRGTVFEAGVDAAFESATKYQAYLFKGNHYTCINYSSDGGHCLFAPLPISTGYTSMKGTIFETGIDAALPYPGKNYVYIFKGDSYSTLSFTPDSSDGRLTGGAGKISAYWPYLGSILPRKDQDLATHDHRPNRNVGGDHTYVTAAFRSSYKNEAYMFMGNEYVLIDYAPGRATDNLLYGPVRISHGYQSLKNTVFDEQGIDCAFSSHDPNEAFIFCGNVCAHIDFGPHSANDKIIRGPMTIAEMFPFLKGTVFENGIDAAFESTTRYEAYLFKDQCCSRINYGFDVISNRLCEIRPISEAYPSLKGTILETGIGAAFAIHNTDEAYLFKGDSYARTKFTPGTLNGSGGVKKISNYWPALTAILPRKNPHAPL